MKKIQKKIFWEAKKIRKKNKFLPAQISDWIPPKMGANPRDWEVQTGQKFVYINTFDIPELVHFIIIPIDIPKNW